MLIFICCSWVSNQHIMTWVTTWHDLVDLGSYFYHGLLELRGFITLHLLIKKLWTRYVPSGTSHGRRWWQILAITSNISSLFLQFCVTYLPTYTPINVQRGHMKSWLIGRGGLLIEVRIEVWSDFSTTCFPRAGHVSTVADSSWEVGWIHIVIIILQF